MDRVEAGELGYEGIETIHEGRRHRLYRGIRSADERKVVIKTSLDSGRQIPELSESLRHEYQVLRSLAPASRTARVARPLALHETRRAGPALVLEDAGPRNLSTALNHRPLPVGEFLEVALDVTDAVAAVHRGRFLHRDITPANLVLDPARRPTLIDFDNATRIIGLSPTEVPGELGGTLDYLAPEQTGRMSRGADQRADLYSLGATFYELVTGAPPFVSTDPVEIVHAHIARAPVPPEAVNPEIPEVLSDLILKLLAKTPELRYQSAEAVLVDLETAATSWRAAGTVEPFELGRADLGRTVPIPDRVYGRERELAILEEALARTESGGRELVAVTGPAGCGKSRLVDELARRSGLEERLLVSKAEPVHGDLPYASWAQLFQPLVREILAAEGSEREAWRRRLVGALGRSGQLLIGLIPELESLFADQEPPPPLGPLESERRFHRAFAAFVGTLAEGFASLVLFLDDLQWTDPASLKLLETLATGNGDRRLLVVAYRGDEVDDDHPVACTLEAVRAAGTPVTSIELPPLGPESITEMLAEGLTMPPDRVRGLAGQIHVKTAGNPFFVRRFIAALHHRRLLVFDFDSGTWRWNDEEIEEAEVTDNVVELMLEAVRRLDPETQRVLRVAACFRKDVELEVLAAAIGEPSQVVAGHLWPALRARLLIPHRGSDRTASYRFAHDRIREALYGLSPLEERRGAHLGIGRHLLARRSPALGADLFEIADQLALGAELVTSPAERLEMARIHARAGAEARKAAAYAPALGYLVRAIELLGPDGGWRAERDLAFRLHRDAAECAVLAGEDRRSEDLVAATRAHPLSPFEAAELVDLEVVACSMRGEFDEAIRRGRDGLAALGIELPADPVAAWAGELAEVRRRLAEIDPAQLAAGPRMTSARHRSTLELLSNLIAPAYVSNSALLAFLAGRIVNLSLQHGNASTSALAYATFAMVVASEGDYATAHAVGRAGVELAASFGDPVQECRTLHVVGSFVNHWRAPLASSLPLLRRSIARGLEGGELQFAVYASATLIVIRFHMGDRLGEISGELESFLDFAVSARIKAGPDYLVPYRRAIRVLRGRPRGFAVESLDGSSIAAYAGNPLSLAFHFILALETSFLARELEHALEMSEAARPHLEAVGGIVALADHNFFTSLALAGCRPVSEALPAIAAHQRQLRAWSANCPINVQHKVELVEAEVARLEDRPLEAAATYDRAIDSARQARMKQDEAIANELAGRFWRRLGRRRIARLYLRTAMECYGSWGATSKVLALEEEFPEAAIESRTLGPPLRAGTARRAALDLLTFHKACESLSGEIVLERLLEKLVATALEIAGATRGALLLAEDGELVPSAAEPPGEGPRIAPTVVDRAFRHNEPVVLGDLTHAREHADDPTIRGGDRTGSLLAVPVTLRGRPVGVLQLENHLASGAFAPERVRVVCMLAAQIGIYLENSRLFEGLEREVAERRRAEESLRYLADASVTLARGLEEHATLRRLARLAVPFLADWSLVRTVGPGTRLEGIAAFHGDPGIEEPTSERIAGGPIAEIARAAIHSGEPQPRSMSSVSAAGGWLPPQTRSLMAVSLIARERCLGVLILGSARPPATSDLVLAQELANRAALALDNAQLHHQTENAVRLRDEFLSIAAHELRTPITSLKLAAQALLGGEIAPSGEPAARLTRIFERQTTRLASLVEDLLSVSRIHMGLVDLNLQDVDLTALVRDVLDTFESQLEQTGTELTVRAGPPVVGRWDRDRLDQVVTNLVSNAIKFGAGKPIVIEIELAAERGAARLRVIDHGIGIEPDRVPYVFARFERGVSAFDYGGLGLGLYIAKQIVNALGGSIAVDSTLGKGTTFTVRLPLSGPHAQGLDPDEPAPPRKNRPPADSEARIGW